MEGHWSVPGVSPMRERGNEEKIETTIFRKFTDVLISDLSAGDSPQMAPGDANAGPICATVINFCLDGQDIGAQTVRKHTGEEVIQWSASVRE